MKAIQYIMLLMIVVLQQSAKADSYLTDPVSGKKILYYHHSVKAGFNELNPFQDLEFILPVVKENKRCTDSISSWIMRWLKSPGFKKSLKEHAAQAISNSFRESEYGQELSGYDQQAMSDQNIAPEDIEATLFAYYNGLLCIRIETRYEINRSYGNMKKDIAMFRAIYVDAATGTVRSLEDLCPPKLKAKFSAALSRQLNLSISGWKQLAETAKRYEQAENDEPYSEYIIAEQPKPISVIKFQDLVFDPNAMNFLVAENSSNTLHTQGAPFVMRLSPDSLQLFLPFTINKSRKKFDGRLSPSIVNKKLYIYRSEYYFFMDEQLLDYFERKLDTKEMTVYFRQDMIGDTSFKNNMSFKFNADHTIAELRTNYNSNNEACLYKKYHYQDSRLRKIEVANEKGISRDAAVYAYNNEGFVSWFVDQDEYDRSEHVFSYDGLTVNDCYFDGEHNKCYTTEFDSAGNFLSRFETGTDDRRYRNTYKGSLLMAGGDALYSYDAEGKIESSERDRGRYYTTYHYDSGKRLSMIQAYDGKELTSRTEVKYDSNERIERIIKTSYSYSKLQTQVEHRIEYR